MTAGPSHEPRSRLTRTPGVREASRITHAKNKGSSFDVNHAIHGERLIIRFANSLRNSTQPASFALHHPGLSSSSIPELVCSMASFISVDARSGWESFPAGWVHPPLNRPVLHDMLTLIKPRVSLSNPLFCVSLALISFQLHRFQVTLTGTIVQNGVFTGHQEQQHGRSSI